MSQDPEESSDDSGQEENILCLPSGIMAAGKPGAEMTVTARGTLVHSQDGMDYLHVDEVNGKPVMNEQSGGDDSEEEEPTEDSLRAKAGQQDDDEGED